MADDINQVTIEIGVEDNTEEGMKEIEGHLKASVKMISGEFENKLGSSIYSADGKLNKFDRSLKNATDTSNLASKSVNRLVRMFNPFNLAIAAAISGITSLAAAMYKSAVEDSSRYHNALKEILETTRELVKETEKEIEKQRLLAIGFTEGSLKAIELEEKRGDLIFIRNKAEAELMKNLEEYRDTSIPGMDRELENRRQRILAMDEEIKKLDLLIVKQRGFGEAVTETSIGKMATEGRAFKRPEEKTRLPTGAEGTFSKLFSFAPSIEEAKSHAQLLADTFRVYYYEQVAGFNERAAEASKNRREVEIASEQMATEALLDLAEMRYASIEEMESRMEQSRRANVERFIATTESVAGTISTIVDTVGKVAAAAIKDEKKRMQATAAITAILESIAAAVEIAKAIGAYPDVVGMAAHAASAAAHITAAVLAAKYGGGGVTTPSKSAGGGSNAGAFQGNQGDQGPRQTTIIIQGHIFSPEGGASFVRSAMEASEDQRNPGRTRKEVT